MTTPIFPEVNPTTGALPAFTEARYATPAQVGAKANSASPTLTGTVTVSGTLTGAGVTKSAVGLGNVDNTSDATKLAGTAVIVPFNGTAWVDPQPADTTRVRWFQANGFDISGNLPPAVPGRRDYLTA